MYNEYMEVIKSATVPTNNNSPNVRVREYDFVNPAFNDADIIISGRYPATGYAVNRRCTALVSVIDGKGGIALKNGSIIDLVKGDRVVIERDDPYYFLGIGEFAIRYTAFPRWTADQAENIE